MSPLFERLPYWRELSIRHCLDVMHIEKNVCDNIINTLLNVPNKSKDNAAARKDMMDMKIRPELAPQEDGLRTYLPPAAHTLSKKEKIEFCKCLHGVEVPEGYSSNISSLVSMRDLRLSGLKSHDCHALMQQLLVVGIRSILPKKVRYAITRFCFFFNAICNKINDPGELDALQNLIVTSLCQFEIYFPPSFFTIMVHLTVHLVREIKYLGPVYLRYQYPFERLMKVYKDYTSNRYRPEGCINERAIIDEALSYCYTHLSNSELLGIPKNRHSDWMMGKGLRGHVRQNMAIDKFHTAHTYVLHNEDEVQPYIEEHMVFLRTNHRNKTEMWITSEHNKTFRVWFKGRVIQDLKKYPDCISSRLRRLCFGPNTYASSYSGYAINGCTFYTREQDDKSTMQNSGVCLEAEAMHFSSSKDKNPVLCKMHYYGVIEEIWVLDYTDFKIPVFWCKWSQSKTDVRKDELGFTLVNLDKFGHKEDPFILATQAKQVFYVTDPLDKNWSVVLSVRSRRDVDSFDEDVVFEGFDRNVSNLDDSDTLNTSSLYTRDDHNEGIWITTDTPSKKRLRGVDT
ncbi:uncharacterized protein LOC141631013 [Silene latifolia]|uniref:uncharacterized protein LOC141631013 n=1 Tax=Silene latifolia TaxID=37657 RepID=UPI003D779997